MAIDFQSLNDELKQHLSSATAGTNVDVAMAEIQKIRDGIKVDIISFIKEINRATMKAKDLEPNSSEFNTEIDRIARGLTGVHIFSGSLLPYDAMLAFMKTMKEKGL